MSPANRYGKMRRNLWKWAIVMDGIGFMGIPALAEVATCKMVFHSLVRSTDDTPELNPGFPAVQAHHGIRSIPFPGFEISL